MSDDAPRICGHRWWASRIEVPTSVPVLHVCVEPWENHAEHSLRPGSPPGIAGSVATHRCACGATLCGDGPGPEGPSRAWTAAAAPLGPTWARGWRRC